MKIASPHPRPLRPAFEKLSLAPNWALPRSRAWIIGLHKVGRPFGWFESNWTGCYPCTAVIPAEEVCAAADGMAGGDRGCLGLSWVAQVAAASTVLPRFLDFRTPNRLKTNHDGVDVGVQLGSQGGDDARSPITSSVLRVLPHRFSVPVTEYGVAKLCTEYLG